MESHCCAATIGRLADRLVAVPLTFALALSLFLLLASAAAAAESGSVKMKIGGRQSTVQLKTPPPLVAPEDPMAAAGAPAAAEPAAEAAPAQETTPVALPDQFTAEDLAKLLPAAGELPNDKAVLLVWEEEQDALTARVWDFKITTTTQGQIEVSEVVECPKVLPEEDNKLVLDMTKFACPVNPRHNAFIEVKSQAGKVSYFQMDNRSMPQTGDDVGVALTLVDRWKQEGPEGARVNGGASFYYSLANLKTGRFRIIGNASVLDSDPELDFEMGIGLGILFKAVPLVRNGNTTSFGIAAGIGYNLMLDHSNQRPYTFFGFSMNFQQQGQEE